VQQDGHNVEEHREHAMGWRKTQVESSATAHRYDDEILSVSWNPVIELIAKTCYPNKQDSSECLREDWSKLDVDTFLDRFYALAAQA
jgi:hypothetical protein